VARAALANTPPPQASASVDAWAAGTTSWAHGARIRLIADRPSAPSRHHEIARTIEMHSQSQPFTKQGLSHNSLSTFVPASQPASLSAEG